MTDMKRITVSLPDDIVKCLDTLRKTGEFRDRPYSEIIRSLVQRGLDKPKQKGGEKSVFPARSVRNKA